MHTCICIYFQCTFKYAVSVLLWSCILRPWFFTWVQLIDFALLLFTKSTHRTKCTYRRALTRTPNTFSSFRSETIWKFHHSKSASFYSLHRIANNYALSRFLLVALLFAGATITTMTLLACFFKTRKLTKYQMCQSRCAWFWFSFSSWLFRVAKEKEIFSNIGINILSLIWSMIIHVNNVRYCFCCHSCCSIELLYGVLCVIAKFLLHDKATGLNFQWAFMSITESIAEKIQSKLIDSIITYWIIIAITATAAAHDSSKFL